MTEPRKKTFTITGAIEPLDADRHFFIPPAITPLVEHIEQGNIAMLYGARGTGKTTTALHALRYVNKKHDWIYLMADLSSVPVVSSEELWRGISTRFRPQAALHGVHLQPFSSSGTFEQAFARSTLGDRVRFVLAFDEFDSLESPRAGVGVKDEVRSDCSMQRPVVEIAAFLGPERHALAHAFLFLPNNAVPSHYP